MNPAVNVRQRVRRHPVAKMYYRLRTRRDTPRQRALAVFMGVVVGCTPLYGLHIFICLALARLTGVNGITTYLAAFVNNPLTAPLIFYVSLGTGHWLFMGEWPHLSWDAARAAGAWHFGRHVLVGTLIVGLALGVVCAALVYWVSKPPAAETPAGRLVESTARRYLDTGIFNWEFVRGKLTYDPLYLGLLQENILPAQGRLLDLGCGRGQLLALLGSATEMHALGVWQPGWPPPPAGLTLAGVDRRARHVGVAREVLASRAELRTEDLTTYEPPPCSIVTLLDVLFYMSPNAQHQLIARVHDALAPGGLLLIREPDAAAGARFTVTRLAEALYGLCRGRFKQRYHYRSAAEWTRLLEDAGFGAKLRPMSARTPFANVLIEARKRQPL
ncbi:MAG: DUF2062 domain-containing protein [Gammaproteobacteria bacterium]|nr:DUF2062 domain-containing protein [Gammaproteobacteria bacterium]